MWILFKRIVGDITIMKYSIGMNKITFKQKFKEWFIVTDFHNVTIEGLLRNRETTPSTTCNSVGDKE